MSEHNPLKRASWLELFYDLAFVALIAQLTYLAADYHSTWRDVLHIFIVGYSIFIAWWATTANRNLQDSEGTRDKLLVQVQMAGAFLMSLTMPGVFEGSYFAFFATLGVMRLGQVFMILRMYRIAPESRPQTYNVLQGLGVGGVLWVLSGFIPDPWHFIVAFQALAVDVLSPLTKGKGNQVRMLNISHLQERLGLFLMLVLGESMLVVALSNSNVSVTAVQAMLVFSGFIFVVAIWWLYFHFLEQDAEGVRPTNMFVYLQSHGFLFGGIVLVAAAYKNFVTYGTVAMGDVFLVLAGASTIAITISLIRAVSYGRKPYIVGRFVTGAVIGLLISGVLSLMIDLLPYVPYLVTLVFVMVAIIDSKRLLRIG